MKPKLILIGAAVTAVTVVAAVVAVLDRPSLSSVEVEGEPAFAALREDPAGVARIVLSDADKQVTLTVDDAGRWTVADKHGYPADAARVRELVASLVDMQLVEAKTNRPERYGRLNLQDLESGDSEATRIRLERDGGEALADALFGKRYFGYAGGERTGIYIRRAGDDRAWLASGGLTPRTAAGEWLDKTVVDVASDRVRQMEITPPEGEKVVASREGQDADFELAAVPEGRTLKAADVRRLGSVLAGVSLEDVRPADQVDLPDQAYAVDVVTFDGLAVTARVAERDDGWWATVSASAVQGEDEDAEKGEEAKAAAAAVNGRVEGWAYRIPRYVAERMTVDREALLEAPGDDGTS